MGLNRRQHAHLARQLIEACGNLEEAAGQCRVKKSALADYQSPTGEGFMPADVIADLEAYCGRAIYSRALFEARPELLEAQNITDEACEAAEAVTILQQRIRLAAKDGVLTPRERAELSRDHAKALDELREVGALLSREAG